MTMTRRFITAFIAVFSSIPILAQHSEFPVYDDFSLPDPGKSTLLRKESLKPTDAFLDQYPDGIPAADNATLHKICNFYRNTSDGQKEWAGLASLTARVVSEWRLKGTGGFSAERYVIAVPFLKNIALVYIFTGEPLISEFIRANMAKMASLPITFWLHSELRGYNPDHPRGGLETAAVNVALTYALPAVRKDMSDEEYDKFVKVWYEYGHVPVYNWLDQLRANNWTAVLGCGLLHSARYFNDQKARVRALNALKYFASATIEDDGSYAEGYSYLSYPVEQLFSAALMMSPKEIQMTFGKANLSGSMTWRIYGHLFDVEEDATPGVMRISYGDNPYGNRELFGADKTSYFMQLVYRDAVAKWLRSKYGSRQSAEGLLLEAKIPDVNIPMQSPVGAGLPLIKAFGSGDCFIRSNWEDEGIVLGLRAGDLGSRVMYSHNRPELNSITLGAFGEYIIVNPGSASYRSRIHNEYDIMTRSANTITIDGKSQKAPVGPQVREGRWDNSSMYVKGFPHAVVTRCEELSDGGSILRSEANDAYHIEMNEASRTVRFHPTEGGGFFVVRDKMIPSDGQSHRFDYRLHIFNRDEMTVITGKGSNLKIQRGKADLYVVMTSEQELKYKKGQGYMHHPEGRDYTENGPKQGFLGSSIELNWSTDATELGVTAILYPVRHGKKAPKIKIEGDNVIVNGKSYPLNE